MHNYGGKCEFRSKDGGKYLLKNFISVHEHFGYGKLSFRNGTFTEYNATAEGICSELLRLKSFLGTANAGCVLYPQMPYIQYSTKKEYANLSVEQLNGDFFASLPVENAVDFYPFIYLRVKDKYAYNKKMVDMYSGKMYGIKLHPDAEQATTKDFIESGILSLAEEYQKPITIHCSRPDREFDLKRISTDLMESFARCTININIAHLGFMSSYMRNSEFPSNIYFDCSPLGIIEDEYSLSNDSKYDFEMYMVELLNKFKKRIMYGGDYPYNFQKWEDGSLHGKDRIIDAKYLLYLLQKSEAKLEDIFYHNIRNFLYF